MVRKSCKMEVEPDRISDLPENIIEQIFSYLPVSDAARTSILSSKWRYRWAMLPNLDLTSLSDDLSFEDEMDHYELVSVIDQILLLHFGPIHKFKLVEDNIVLDDSAMDRWIHHLTRGSIKDIFWRNCREDDYYRVPSCLFFCQSLINLDLSFCSLKPPPSFKGFSKLKSLDFSRVNMAQDVLENLVSSSPMLEILKLLEVRSSPTSSFSHLNINAPSLRFFSFWGVLKGIGFENTSFLAEVTLRINKSHYPYNPNRACENSSRLLKFFDYLPRIQRLTIDNYALKYLSVGVKLGELLKPCVHLHFLSIEIINLNNWKESLTALCLLSIAPNLQELKIYLPFPSKEETVTGMETNLWEDGCRKCQLTKLQFVTICRASPTEAELNFIKFILVSSPVLERMFVKPSSGDVELELFKKLLSLRRSSGKAQIICYD